MATTQAKPNLTSRTRLYATVDVCAATGWSRVTLWRHVTAGDFPKPFKWYGQLRWRESTIAAAIEKAEKAGQPNKGG